MKKIIAITLAALLLAGCGASTVKTGLGNTISIAKSKDATAEAGGVAQVDTMMAAVTVDGAGKIVGVQIDTAQVKVGFDATGKITADKAAALKTKRELGNDYGMKKASGIGKEWFEQVDDLQKWMVGKTSDQIKNMKVKEVEGGKLTDEADINTKVTVKITDFIETVTEAIANAK